ncbi:MAG TPA: sulfide-dependent adenosine diphosphate thiazole synthase [Candidatus Atribacteria bacterium]|nr:sulfide-dependent adenosine diphosphate thiazole synthase [Candidatus Atribacteria bacterium]
MKLDEVSITKAIVERYFERLMNNLEIDVAIVGGGPSGLVAGYFLAKAGCRVVLYERKLSVGGGMWGGGMLFNEIVVQQDARRLLDELEVRTTPYKEPGYYTASSVESVSTITSKAVKAGLSIFNCVSVEDVVVKNDRISGLVINWTAVSMAGLHVDPLSVRSRFIIDATGHDTEVVAMIERKAPGKLATPSGNKEGEKFMNPEEAEKLTLENTREVFSGLYVTGMACNATFGGPRMGPIFGGMLLSGEKVAQLILKEFSR